MPVDETPLYSLSKANLFFAKSYNGVCWSYLGKDNRSTDDTAKMINLAHASLLHWSESEVCTPANLQRGEFLVSMAYSAAGRGEPAYYHAKRCFDLTFSELGSMNPFDIAYAYMAMARVSALTGLDNEAKEYLSKMVDAARATQNKVDMKIFIGDLDSGNWYNVTDLVRENVKLLISTSDL
jgi:hypothetical protein